MASKPATDRPTQPLSATRGVCSGRCVGRLGDRQAGQQLLGGGLDECAAVCLAGLGGLDDVDRDRAHLAGDDDADWDALWWVRADGRGRVLAPEESEARSTTELLGQRYPQQRAVGSVLAVDVEP